jgi:restriction endonuclease
MKYGQLAGNRAINAFIYRCFESICDEDERKFVKKFRKQPDDSDQIMHTFRELVLGAYLHSCNIRVKHDYVVDNKTPDWCILDDNSAVIGIVELTNFHIDKLTESEIERQKKTKRIAVFWRDKNKDNLDRLYHCIRHKAQVYQDLAKELKIPYVIAVFGEFQVALDLEEVRFCLFDKKIGLFKMYPEVSGVLYFNGSFGQYSFNYASNPSPLQLMDLPSGVFP